MKYDPEKLLFAVDRAGTLLFAIEGATAAIIGNLDLLGLMVLTFATAPGGGIIRDLLIGAVPPNSLRDWRYSAVAFTGAAIVFFLHRFVQGIPGGVIIVLDAAARIVRRGRDTESLDLQNAAVHRHSARPLQEWVEARFAICSWPAYPTSCAPTSMPRQP